MSKTSLFLYTALIVAVVSCVKEPDPIPVTGITLNVTSLEITEGEQDQITASISPYNADNKVVIWSSSNSSVATVSDGTVSAISPGNATVTAKTDDGGYTATCQISVKARHIPVSEIRLDSESLSLYEGGSKSLSVTVLPENASDKSVTWTSDATDVATVENGIVKAVKAGSAAITVVSVDSGVKATCTVSVIAPVSGITLDKDTMVVRVGFKASITATITPANASNTNISWSSSNTSVATVSDGVVTAVGAGTAMITATTEDGGMTASCTVTVPVPVSGVMLNKSSLSMKAGETAIISAIVSPSDAADKSIVWSSSNSSVVTVKDRLVTAVAPGNAEIVVSTVDGGFTASCAVTVIEPVTGISLDKTTLSMVAGQSATLSATVSPAGATDKSVNWTSDNTSVATVSSGKVYAVGKGTAVIKATTTDGGFSASCTVSVQAKATSLALSRKSFLGHLGCKYDISVEVSPADAACDIEWSTSNNYSIAYVASKSEDSRTATIQMASDNYSGYTRLTARDKNSGLSAYLDVYMFASDFTWTETSDKTYYSYPLITIAVGEQHQLQYTCSPYLTNLFESIEDNTSRYFVLYGDCFSLKFPSIFLS